MRGSLARWRVALRIARRSGLRAKARSLLVVALIAVPIMGLTGGAVLLPSAQSTVAERIRGNLGSAQARLQVLGGPGDRIEQGAEGGYDYQVRNQDASDPERVDPRTVLPAGTRVLAVGSGAAVFTTPTGSASLAVTTGPSWDPSLDGGPYALLSGRRPTAPDEVLVSPAALERLGARVGGTIELRSPEARTLRVVGTQRDRSQPDIAQMVFGPASLVREEDATPDLFTYWVPDAPIDWATVRRLNAAGITAFSRQVVLDPPALPADLQYSQAPFNPSTLIVIAIALVFAVLEVALLAGSAFLVGARQQQRALATVATVGADRSVLRRIVTANGVVLGLVGGLVGAVLGVVGALLVMRVTDDGSWTRYPGVHLVWPLLAAIVLFGVVVGWIAALVPARAASRLDVVRALRGARTPQRTGKRPIAGVVLLAIGIGATLVGGVLLVPALKEAGDAGTRAQLGALALLGGGPVVAQLGVILCAGLVLRGVSRLLDRAPLGARLAARDTSRNLGRAVPAVASVMTTVFVAAFAMCIANTSSQQAAATYYWNTARAGDAVSRIGTRPGETTPSTGSVQIWRGTIERSLPTARTAVLAETRQGGTDDPTPSNRARDAVPFVRFPDDATCSADQARDAADPVCGRFSARNSGQPQQTITVGDPDALALLLGHRPSAAAVRALDTGGAVALRSDLAPRGRAIVDWFTPRQLAKNWTSGPPRRTTRIDAAVDLPEQPLESSLFVTPATARALRMNTAPSSVLMTFERPPTDAELDAVNAALGAAANQPDSTWITVEQGPQDTGSTIAWYVLLACLVVAIAAGATAVGLARVDGRPDDVTLASLGASPRIRRTVAAAQALLVCGVGAAVGTALGLLPAVALGGATTSFPFSPPTVQLVLLVVGIPALLAAGSWLLVGRGRADLTRRTAIA